MRIDSWWSCYDPLAVRFPSRAWGLKAWTRANEGFFESHANLLHCVGGMAADMHAKMPDVRDSMEPTDEHMGDLSGTSPQAERQAGGAHDDQEQLKVGHPRHEYITSFK